MKKKYLLYIPLVFIIYILLKLLIGEIISPYLADNNLEKTTRIPNFTELKSPYSHSYTDENTQPILGGAIFDVDNDGSPEVFVTGAKGQDDFVMSYKDGKIINITQKTGLSDKNDATHGAAKIDIDKDGDDDLIVARTKGVYLYKNNNGVFSKSKIKINFEKDVIPLYVSVADVDNDGNSDLYISTFKDKPVFKQAIFNDEPNKSMNVFLHNNGDGTFTDKTIESGLAYRQNTFLSKFADFNGDNLPDLIVSPNTDRLVLYKNLGGGKFSKPVYLSDYGFWMGLAIDDVDNDGDLDLFATNIGTPVPMMLLKGDSREDQKIDISRKMYRNDGDFKFSDITKQTGLDINNLGWGTEFADFNNDGRLDLIATENFITFPLHKIYRDSGKLLIQNPEGKFVRTEARSGVSNRNYGYTPLVTDLNSDGYKDLIIINMQGPTRVFINNGE